ncbi:MAG TPA: 3-isopropylmalate dehydrogenase [Chloroflexota bacterium]|nr:3-isopropylmalate dehydrogenase [Chloroflexota bacterium]
MADQKQRPSNKTGRTPLFRLTVLPGDGIGPEVVAEALKLLQALEDRGVLHLSRREAIFGGGAIDATGSPLPDDTLAACLEADAILLGAVGGPKWDSPRATVRPEAGLLGLRKKLGVFANLRPVKAWPALADSSPVRRELVEGTDLVVVRELTGGLYFGRPRGRQARSRYTRVVDSLVYTSIEIERILHVAFQMAQGRRKLVTSVDKANVLTSSALWRELAIKVGQSYPDVTLEHALVDSASMQLIRTPGHFDVLVMENLFGDILSDEASVLAGSLGMLPSASLGTSRRGLYEPIHGSAPDIAGKGWANPLGTILSVAMMLRHSFGLEDSARAVESAVGQALDAGCRTRDIAAPGTPFLHTHEMGDEVVKRLR